MFKKTSQTTPGASTPPPAARGSSPADALSQPRVKEHKRSVLSPAITVSGDISGSEDLLLDGNMEGSVHLPDNEVLIGPEGRIKANVTALRVYVEGRLTGDIKSAERVVIKQSGRVEGNIVAPRVVLEDGCQFKGSVEMNIDSESSGSRTTRTTPETTHSGHGAPRESSKKSSATASESGAAGGA